MKSKVVAIRNLTNDVFEIQLDFPGAEKARAGQFVEVSIDGFFLRRPISVCCGTQDKLTLVVKITGKGTRVLAQRLKSGEIKYLDVIGPFGQGFPMEEIADQVHSVQNGSFGEVARSEKKKLVLVGGGIGIPPLYEVAREALALGIRPIVYLGFNTFDDVFYVDEFKQLGLEVLVTVVQPSAAFQSSKDLKYYCGSVIDILSMHKGELLLVCGCGPIGMLEAIEDLGCEGYLSFEGRMACGYGVCMGCSVLQKDGQIVRVCKDGPVFKIGQIEFNQRFL